MRIPKNIGLLGILLLLAGCSNTRFLAEDELLYTGHSRVQITTRQEGINTTPVKMHVNSATDFKVNNGLFGRRILPPVGLWVHNYWKVNEEKKFGNWVQKTLAASPVLVDDVNPDLRAQKIQSDLFDMGYFQAKAWSVVDTSSRNPKKARVNYFVDLSPPYRYNDIEILTDNRTLDTLMKHEVVEDQIHPGDQFDLEKLTRARDGLARNVQNLGYFYFTPDYIDLNLDTAIGGNRMDLEVRHKPELPPEVLDQYEINRITLYLSRPSDSVTAVADTTWTGDLRIISTGNYLKNSVLGQAVFFKRGELYTYDAFQKTITRLNGLGVFSFVRTSYEPSDRDGPVKGLDVRIDLILADNISTELETNVVTKSTGFTGPAMAFSVSHGNAFRGAAKVRVGVNGGIEWQWGPKEENQLGTFSYDLGISSSLTFPRLLLPEKRIKDHSRLIQQSSVNLDARLLNRTAYYSMFSIKTDVKYTWGNSRLIQHSFSPAYINSVYLLATTPAFDSVINDNIYIRKSFEEQFIVGMKYDFIYDNTYRNQTFNFFFQGGLSTSGNLLDAVHGLTGDRGERPYSFFGNIYSQYIKLTSDLRFYLNGYNKTLALRLYTGAGFPYLNSSVLPYVEQFFSGGAYSIRGFSARSLGPGSFYETERTYIDQSGDVKLEANLEFRFGITKVLKGAVFVDAGNIWLVNEDENRPGSKFHFDSFYRQLAVGSGVGLRFDFNFFVVRADLGIPLRTPYVLDDRQWVAPGKALSNSLFYLAIGYPF